MPSFCRRAVEYTVRAPGRLVVLVNHAAFQLHTIDMMMFWNEHSDETLKKISMGISRWRRPLCRIWCRDHKYRVRDRLKGSKALQPIGAARTPL